MSENTNQPTSPTPEGTAAEGPTHDEAATASAAASETTPGPDTIDPGPDAATKSGTTAGDAEDTSHQPVDPAHRRVTRRTTRRRELEEDVEETITETIPVPYQGPTSDQPRPVG